MRPSESVFSKQKASQIFTNESAQTNDETYILRAKTLDLNGESIMVDNVNLLSLEENINKVYDKAKLAMGKDIVLVIGNTGAGKSTLINNLLGCPVTKTRVRGRLCAEVHPNSKGIVYTKTGHGRSETTYPEIVGPGKDIYYVDCPGFIDTRGKEKDICTYIGIQLAVKFARNVKAIVICVSESSFNDRNVLLTKLVHTLSCILPIEKLEQLKRSIIFAITKSENTTQNDVLQMIAGVKEDYENDINDEIKNAENMLDVKPEHRFSSNVAKDKVKNSWEAFKDYMGQTMSKISGQLHALLDPKKIAIRENNIRVLGLMNKDNIVLYDPFNDTSRDEIIERLHRMISSIGKEFIQLDKIDDIQLFNRIIYIISQNGIHLLQNKKRIPIEIIENEKELNDTIIKIESIKKRINELNNPSANKQKEIDDIKKDITDNNVKIDGLRKEIYNLKNEIQACNDKITNEIKPEEEVIHSDKPKADEKRAWGIFGWLGYTSKKLVYNHKDTPITRVNKTKTRGYFKNEKENKSDGYYEVTYETDWGDDGYAEVEIYVKNKDLPEKAKELKNTKSEIDKIQKKISNKEDEIQQLIKDNKSNENLIIEKDKNDEGARKQAQIKMHEDLDRNIKKESDVRKTIERLKGELEIVKQRISILLPLFVMVKDISTVMSFSSNLIERLGNINSGLVFNFLHLLNQSGLLESLQPKATTLIAHSSVFSRPDIRDNNIPENDETHQSQLSEINISSSIT